MTDTRLPLARIFGTSEKKQAAFESWQLRRVAEPPWSQDWCTHCGAKAEYLDANEQLTGDGYCPHCLESMFDLEMGAWDVGHNAISGLLHALHDDGGMPSEQIMTAVCEALPEVAGPEDLEKAADLLREKATAYRERLSQVARR